MIKASQQTLWTVLTHCKIVNYIFILSQPLGSPWHPGTPRAACVCVCAYTHTYTHIHSHPRPNVKITQTTQIKTAGKWRKCEPYFGASTPCLRLERAVNLVDRLRTSAGERVLSGRRAVVIAWWAGGWLFFIDPSFLVNSHLDHSWAWIPACSAYCSSAAPLLFLQSFYNYARGHCEAARSFFRAMHSVHLISIE